MPRPALPPGRTSPGGHVPRSRPAVARPAPRRWPTNGPALELVLERCAQETEGARFETTGLEPAVAPDVLRSLETDEVATQPVGDRPGDLAQLASPGRPGGVEDGLQAQ